MADTVIKSNFPNQIADDSEKRSFDYGLRVAEAIEHEWFGKRSDTDRFHYNKTNFHKLRLYARGEESIQKY